MPHKIIPTFTVITIVIMMAASSILVFCNSNLPPYDPNWQLLVDGEVNQNLTLTTTNLTTMPPHTIYAELFCYGTYIESGNYTGVTLGQLADAAQANQTVNQITLTASDGYQLIINSITHPQWQNLIVAYAKDNQPLDVNLRLILPDENGESWIASITEIIFNTIQLQTPQPTTTPSPEPSPTPTSTTPQTSPTPSPITEPENQTSPQTPTSSANSGQQPQSSNSISRNQLFYLIVVLVAVVALVSLVMYVKHKR